MSVPLNREHLQNRKLKMAAIIIIGGDKLSETLITAVLCSGVLDPSSPDTALFAACRTDILLACLDIGDEINARHSGEFLFPCFI